MRSKGAAGALYSWITDSLSAKVVLIYLGVAIAAALLAVSSDIPLYFVPLLVLAAPFGIILLDQVASASLLMQTLFLVVGVGINAWLAGMLAVGIRYLRQARRPRSAAHPEPVPAEAEAESG